MFGLPILDVALGLMLVYTLLALVCTAAQELIAGWLDRRANTLVIGIHNLLGEKQVKQPDAKNKQVKGLVEQFYAHPLIKALYENGTKPSYIPARTFALTLLDMVASSEADTSGTVESLKNAVKNNSSLNSDLKRSLLVLMDEAGSDLKLVQANLEIWFNNTMERVSGWYKQRTQWIGLLLAALVTLIANADTIQIAEGLSNDPALREALVAQAQEFAANPPDETTSPADRITENIGVLQNLGLKLGWPDEFPARWDETLLYLLNKLLGLMLTTLAVSLGAPFWFDLLNKFIIIRGVGKSPDELSKPPEAPAKRVEEMPPK